MTIMNLEGCSILIVEDDFMQASEMTTFLESEGAHVIGPTGRAREVPRLLAEQSAHAALLDINLGRGASYETAQLLMDEGVPFAFLTGYDHSAIPEKFAKVPCLNKPALGNDVSEMLVEVIARAKS